MPPDILSLALAEVAAARFRPAPSPEVEPFPSMRTQQSGDTPARTSLAAVLLSELTGRRLDDGLRRTVAAAHRLLCGDCLALCDAELARLAVGLAELDALGHLDEAGCRGIVETVLDGSRPYAARLGFIVVTLLGAHASVPWPRCRSAVERLAVPLIEGFVRRRDGAAAFWCAVSAQAAMRPVPDRFEVIVPLTRRIERALAPLYREVAANNPRTPPEPGCRMRTVGFVLVGDHCLGHAENLLGMLEGLVLLSDAERRLRPAIYIVDTPVNDGRLHRRLAALGVTCHELPERFPDEAGLGAAVRAPTLLRRAFREDGVDIAVWVAVPHLMPFAFSLGLAPTQIWWSMKFKHDAFPMADGFLYTRSLTPRRETVGTTIWNLGPKALPTAAVPPPPEAVAEMRRRCAGPGPILGVVARGEKIADPPYLQAVATLLDRHPGARFLWTGRIAEPAVVEFFRRRGLGDRHRFIGWVDAAVAVRVFDLYLDTFTLSGITTIHALAAGTPVVELAAAEGPLAALLDPELAGAEALPAKHSRQLRDTIRGLPGLGPPFAAATADDYVARADRLIGDPELRRRYGLACRRFALDWLVSPRHAALAFTENVMDVVARQVAARPAAARP